MHMIISVNKPGTAGNIMDYSLSNIAFDNISPSYVLYNSFYTANPYTLSKTGTLNNYSGAVFTMNMLESWNLKMNVKDLVSVGDCHIGYLSGDINNINKFGHSGESDEYIGREIEFAYFY